MASTATNGKSTLGFVERRHGKFRREDDVNNAAVGALGAWVTDQQARPLFLVDKDMKPYFSNRAAQDSAQRIEWVRFSKFKLEILDVALEKELKSALARWPKQEGASIHLAKGKRELDLTKIKPKMLASDVYVITLGASGEKSVTPARLMEAFGLTRAEAHVAALIHEGKSRKAVARIRGSKIDTVKKQLGKIFAKMRVGSQRELVKKISEWAAGSPT